MVAIRVIGASKGLNFDKQGYFTMKVAAGSVLEFSGSNYT